jgi:hypothetical protein
MRTRAILQNPRRQVRVLAGADGAMPRRTARGVLLIPRVLPLPPDTLRGAADSSRPVRAKIRASITDEAEAHLVTMVHQAHGGLVEVDAEAPLLEDQRAVVPGANDILLNSKGSTQTTLTAISLYTSIKFVHLNCFVRCILVRALSCYQTVLHAFVQPKSISTNQRSSVLLPNARMKVNSYIYFYQNVNYGCELSNVLGHLVI